MIDTNKPILVRIKGEMFTVDEWNKIYLTGFHYIHVSANDSSFLFNSEGICESQIGEMESEKNIVLENYPEITKTDINVKEQDGYKNALSVATAELEKQKKLMEDIKELQKEINELKEKEQAYPYRWVPYYPIETIPTTPWNPYKITCITGFSAGQKTNNEGG